MSYNIQSEATWHIFRGADMFNVVSPASTTILWYTASTLPFFTCIVKWVSCVISITVLTAVNISYCCATLV